MGHLKSEHRFAIYLRIKKGWSKRETGFSQSSVSREIKRNSNSRGEHVRKTADDKSKARKPPELWWRVEQMLVDDDLSPGQIAGVLRKEGGARDESHQHSQPHKHTRPPRRGCRHALRRLGDGHHHRFIRTRDPDTD